MSLVQEGENISLGQEDEIIRLSELLRAINSSFGRNNSDFSYLIAGRNTAVGYPELFEGKIKYDLEKIVEDEVKGQDLENKRNKALKSKLPQKEDLQIQTRKKVVDEGLDIIGYMGKSAQENVKLLKAAKPWSIWIHLKDYPSAYAIIFYGKTVKLSDQHIRTAAQWLVEESFRNKKETPGYKVKVIFTECRYVKLLKGDRLGRVTYSLAKELVISI